MKNFTLGFIKKITFLILGMFFFVGCVNVFKISDLRPEGLIDNNEKEKAKELLTKMGVAHGIDKWKDFSTYTVKFGEEFDGFASQQSNPFKNEKTSLSLSYITNTNNGQIEILSGREKGYVWGMQNDQAYTIYDDEIFKTQDEQVRFWVCHYQFLIEFPSRIQKTTSLAYLGKKTINGASCEGVMASWNTLEPQKDKDQYLIWIDSASNRITKLEYTIRDLNSFQTETVYFKNYNNYEGIILPAEFQVESNLVKKGLLHKMSIYGFTRDLMHVNSLLPLNYLNEDE